MAKRFTATEIWKEDWYLEMPIEYKLFWFYMKDTCDHAGLFKVNIKTYCLLNEVKLTPKKALEYFNSGKQRIREISESIWFIEDFFVYQYGEKFNINNRVHSSIFELYKKHNIRLASIRGLKVVTEGVKDKDKEKDIEQEQLDRVDEPEKLVLNNTTPKRKKKTKADAIKNAQVSLNGKIFKLEDVGEIRDVKINAAIELLKTTTQQDVSREQIISMWSAFKKQNLPKWYADIDDIERHFINWVVKKKFTKNEQGKKEVGKTFTKD